MPSLLLATNCPEDLLCSAFDIAHIIHSWNNKSSSGPDNIPIHMLKSTASTLKVWPTGLEHASVLSPTDFLHSKRISTKFTLGLNHNFLTCTKKCKYMIISWKYNSLLYSSSPPTLGDSPLERVHQYKYFMKFSYQTISSGIFILMTSVPKLRRSV